MSTQKFTIEIEQEQNQRWIAEVIELPGVMAYAGSPDDANAKVQALALRVLADRLEHGELVTEFLNIHIRYGEAVAEHARAASSRRSGQRRMGVQAAIRLPPVRSRDPRPTTIRRR